MKIIVIMLASGSGSRMKASENKILLSLCGKSVIRRSAEAFTEAVDKMIIVCKTAEQPLIQKQLHSANLSFPIFYTVGGETRQQSVFNGLMSLDIDENDIILIHDAARCLIDRDMIRRVISSVIKYGACVPGIAASSTYKICNHDSFVISTPDRSSLYEIQTPQGFRAGLILSAAKKAAAEHIECTDDASLLECCNIPVKVVPGSVNNIKLTYPEDIVKATAILKGGQASLRIGMGFDVHQLVPDRRLILCGIDIPFELGLLGHSDADVALHALMDAMLGSCGLGDIGKFFPDSDNQWKDASSMDLLKRVNQIIHDAGFSVCNADITIVAQRPKLLPFIPDMTKNIQDALNLSDHLINVKATTTEHLGFEGRMEGISAYAVCSVKENN